MATQIVGINQQIFKTLIEIIAFSGGNAGLTIKRPADARRRLKREEG